MAGLLQRLDRFGTDDRWRKPRHGTCNLCQKPVIQHPLWVHRYDAAEALFWNWVDGLIRRAWLS